jgi:hypothetical protein
MEIIRQKETGMSKSLTTYNVEVPTALSREKALKFIKSQMTVQNGDIFGIPKAETRQKLYMLFIKIGARDEIPQDKNIQVSYLNDFWSTLYLRNNLCPADIPFHIIMDEFTIAMVQGVIDRKGNNQAAICTAFNSWITRQDVRNRLYEIRNRLYPNQKPKELPKNATEKTIADYSDEELLKKIVDIKPMAGIAMVDHMLVELQKETTKRGLK